MLDATGLELDTHELPEADAESILDTVSHRDRATLLASPPRVHGVPDDMFGAVFEGHPDLRRFLTLEHREGFPQRRDFPVGAEPVLFTYNGENHYGRQP